MKADENEYRLINDLLKNYNIYARPSIDHKHATNVTLGLSLSQLIDVVSNVVVSQNYLINLLVNFFICEGRKKPNNNNKLLEYHGI